MPAGKPESARGVGSLGSAIGRSYARSTAPSSGRKRPAAIKDPKPIGIKGKSGDYRWMSKKNAPKSVRKSVEISKLQYEQGVKKAVKSEISSRNAAVAVSKSGGARPFSKTKTGVQGGGNRMVKPSAAGKKAVAKYSGKVKSMNKKGM